MAPVTLPPPPATAKVTGTAATGLPLASLTMTDGATATVVPAVAVPSLPALTAIWVATPAITVTVPDVSGLTPCAANLNVLGPVAPLTVRSVNAAAPAAFVRT